MSHWPYNFDAYDEYQREEKYLFMRSKGNNAPRKQRVNKRKCVGGDISKLSIFAFWTKCQLILIICRRHFKHQDFCGMYCAILTVNSVVGCLVRKLLNSPLLLQRPIVKERDIFKGLRNC